MGMLEIRFAMLKAVGEFISVIHGPVRNGNNHGARSILVTGCVPPGQYPEGDG